MNPCLNLRVFSLPLSFHVFLSSSWFFMMTVEQAFKTQFEFAVLVVVVACVYNCEMRKNGKISRSYIA